MPLALYHLLWAVYLEPFDYVVQGLGIVTTIVLASLVKTNHAFYSWYIVFVPLWSANFVSAFFQLIIFFRLREEGYSKGAAKRGAWILILYCLLSTFEVLLAHNLQTGKTTLAQALSPIIVLVIAIIVRFIGGVLK